MNIPLDFESDIPLYQQIETYLRQNILSGNLLPETRLPATRQLAESLGISRITVTNAYADLESEGLIYSKEGSGSYVMPSVLTSTPLKNAVDISWPLWQQDVQISDEISGQTDLSQTSPAEAHSQPIAFTGVGDPSQFPVKDFHKAIQAVFDQAVPLRR